MQVRIPQLVRGDWGDAIATWNCKLNRRLQGSRHNCYVRMITLERFSVPPLMFSVSSWSALAFFEA